MATIIKLSWINGFSFPIGVTKQSMDSLAHFSFLPDDVCVVSYPKSGTTWTLYIANLIRQEGGTGSTLTHIFDAQSWLGYTENHVLMVTNVIYGH